MFLHPLSQSCVADLEQLPYRLIRGGSTVLYIYLTQELPCLLAIPLGNMSGVGSTDDPSTPTVDSRTTSTRLGYPPGTPQRKSDLVSPASLNGGLHTDKSI